MDAALLLEAVAVPAALIDSAGRITAANFEWTALSGESCDQSCFELWPAAADGIRAVLAGKKKEHVFGDRLGSRRLRLICRGVPDRGAALITAELTEAKLAAEREMQYRSLNLAVAALSDAVYVFDSQGRFTYASQSLLDLLGRAASDVIGKTVRELVEPPAMAEQFFRDVQQVIATREPVRGETPYTAAGGREGYYEYILHPVIDAEGCVQAVAGSSRDVSGRERVETQLLAYAEEQHALAEELALEHERLLQAQSVAKIGSWVFDIPAQTVTWTDETYRICGLSKADDPRLYEAFRERVHPEDLAALDAAFADAITHGKSHVFDHRLVLPDGSLKWVQERSEIVFGPDGVPLRGIGTIQDITERKASEEVLQQSQQLLRIATSVGHVGGWRVDLNEMTVSWSERGLRDPRRSSRISPFGRRGDRVLRPRGP